MEGIILLSIVFGLLVGAYAKGKNRSFFGWTVLSLLISPILSFIIVAVLKPIDSEATEETAE